MKRRAVFMDRDGTLNEEVRYLSRSEDLLLIPGAGRAVSRVNRAGMAAVVITNQSGVARGYFDEAALASIHDRLREELREAGAHLDGIYYCPHHPEGTVERFRKVCECRKPGTGMVLRAAADLSLDLSASYLVGDHMKDLEVAHRAGMRSVLVLTGYGKDQWESAGPLERALPGYVAEDLSAAVDWILDDCGLLKQD